MKRTRQHKSRIRNLVIALSLTAIILSVSTYAWFIGMRTVSVTSFDVEIAGTEDLLLSLDGADFSETVTINGENYDTVGYENNTNWWAGRGLIPMSTIGEIDPASSRLIIYEKASLTPSSGGYRLMASRIQNGDDWAEHRSHLKEDDIGKEHVEAHGYVAFDLFIQNSTGAEYYTEYNEDDEEAIYLDTKSSVVVSESGSEGEGGVEGTGIENSVRLAFAQIGRMKSQALTAPIIEEITGISCASEGNVTGICQRPASIWEPNDTAHVVGALSWYKESCLARGEDGDFEDADTCAELQDGEYYPTYAVAKEISSTPKVDVYDGPKYNGYEGSYIKTNLPDIYNGFPSKSALDSGEDGEDKDVLLYAVPTFTDTMKNETGTDRRPFMYLAPNSITKVRVYIYIEGQDIDNYDFASIGKQITVNFGFTKQRYIEDDIEGYTHPATSEPTTTTIEP